MVSTRDPKYPLNYNNKYTKATVHIFLNRHQVQITNITSSAWYVSIQLVNFRGSSCRADDPLEFAMSFNYVPRCFPAPSGKHKYLVFPHLFFCLSPSKITIVAEGNAGFSNTVYSTLLKVSTLYRCVHQNEGVIWWKIDTIVVVILPKTGACLFAYFMKMQ